VFSAKALAEIAESSNDHADREHVSLHFWEHPEKYTRRNVAMQLPDYAVNLRLTVDTEDDFRLVNAIYEELYPVNPGFTLSDVIELLRARSDLRSINEHVQQKAVR
jgi:spore coat polysaccharide biosynthesis protein SpsF